MLRISILLITLSLLSTLKLTKCQLDNICLNGGLLSSNICICLPGFIGKNCEISILTSTSISPTTRTTSSSSQTTRPPGSLDSFIQSISDGFIQGLINFIGYYLNLQGLGDTNSLTQQDIEILTDVFVSTLINETETLLQQWKQASPFQNQQDNTIKEKISHLTGNILFILNLQFNDLSKQNLTSNNIDLNSVFQIVFKQLFNDLVSKLNLPTSNDNLNNAIANVVLSYINGNQINVNDLLSQVYNVITGFISSLLSSGSIAKMQHLVNKRSFDNPNELVINDLSLNFLTDFLTDAINNYARDNLPFEAKLNQTITDDKSVNFGFDFKIDNLDYVNSVQKRSSLLKNLLVDNQKP